MNDLAPLVAWFAARPAKVDRLGRERLRRRILRDRWPAAAEVKTAYRRRRGNRRG